MWRFVVPKRKIGSAVQSLERTWARYDGWLYWVKEFTQFNRGEMLWFVDPKWKIVTVVQSIKRPWARFNQWLCLSSEELWSFFVSQVKLAWANHNRKRLNYSWPQQRNERYRRLCQITESWNC